MNDKTRFDHDLGLRHKQGMTAEEFIRQYCEVFRPYAYATRDDSLNEFEKLITHVLNMYCYHRKRSELHGLAPDPRREVWETESDEESIIEGIALVLDEPTINGRIYPREEFENALEDFRARQSTDGVLGQIYDPEDTNTSALLVKVSHETEIVNIDEEGNVHVQVRLMPTPEGLSVKNDIEKYKPTPIMTGKINRGIVSDLEIIRFDLALKDD